MNIFKNPSLCVAAIVLMAATVRAEGVGIADTEITPDASAILDVQSTNQGALFPRMTSAQRFAISSPATGLLVYDTDEDAFYYNSESEWVVLVSESGSPVGEVTAFAGSTNTIPDGWLLCDGTPLNSTNYPALHAAIGSSWGDASDDFNPSTNFRLPDMRGYFLRGVDHGAGNDPNVVSRTYAIGSDTNNSVGSIQGDELKAHNHTYQTAFDKNGAPSGANNSGSYRYWRQGDRNVNTSPSGGYETRPKNVYVNYIIKY